MLMTPKKKMFLLAISFGLLVCFFSRIDLPILPIEVSEPTEQHIHQPSPAANENWTFMVYLNADNELDAYGLADLNEMESAGSTADVKIICMIDRASSGAKTYLVNYDTTPAITSEILTTGFPSEPNMGSKATLKNFMSWVISSYPSEKYALILWGQGGSVTSVSYDESAGDHLTMDEAGEAIAEYTFEAGKQIDLLGLDASLKGTLEVGYQVRDASVEVVVFSQEAEPSGKWPYDQILGGDSYTGLKQNPDWNASQLGSHIVNAYCESYSGLVKITQSVVNATLMSSLGTDLNNFALELNASISTNFLDLVDARNNSQQYNNTEFIDLWDFAEQIRIRDINPGLTSAATTMKASIQAAVMESQHSSDFSVSEGLSIYFPPSAIGFSNSSLSGLKLIEETYWDDFLANYFTTDQDSPWVIAPANLTLQQGDVANLTWQLGDLIAPNEFKLFCNDTLLSNGNYEFTDTASVEVNTTEIGILIYAINVTDRFGHWKFSQVWVEVQTRTFGIYIVNGTIDLRESNYIWLDLDLIAPDILYLSRSDSLAGVPNNVNGKNIISVYNITLAKLGNLNKATIRFYYSVLSQNFMEGSLAVYRLNAQTELWEEIPCTIDTEEKYVEITVDHFTIFAVMGVLSDEEINPSGAGNYILPIIIASVAVALLGIVIFVKVKKNKLIKP
jgi:hypothetical protein